MPTPSKAQQVAAAATDLIADHDNRDEDCALSDALRDALELPDDAPKWSSQVPTEPGLYWWRCKIYLDRDEFDYRWGFIYWSDRRGRLSMQSGQDPKTASHIHSWSGPAPMPDGVVDTVAQPPEPVGE